MQLTLLKCKLHKATVSECDLNYNGSISIDQELMDAAGLLEHEQVDVLNITNGERFTTYVIAAPAGSRKIGINGAAARLAQLGDQVIVCAYCGLDQTQAKEFEPTVIVLDEKNNF